METRQDLQTSINVSKGIRITIGDDLAGYVELDSRDLTDDEIKECISRFVFRCIRDTKIIK